MRRVLVVAVLVAAALGGCTGSGGNPSAEPTFTDLGTATDTTGVIHGLVLDTRIVPIANATVTIAAKNLQTKTDAQGRFGFEKLAPGTYFLRALKPGYAGANTGATVVAGDNSPDIVKILLTADASTRPYTIQTHHTGFVSCGFLTANFVWDASSCDPTGAAGYQASDDSHPRFEVPSPPLYLQTEISWHSTQTLGQELVVIESPCDSPDAKASCYDNTGSKGDTVRLCNNWGPSPLICRMNQTASGSRLADGSYNDGNGVGLNASRLGQADRSGFQVAVFAGCYNGCVIGAVGAGLELNQQFEVYNTYFYGYEPPKDWSFLATGTIPDPPK